MARIEMKLLKNKKLVFTIALLLMLFFGWTYISQERVLLEKQRELLEQTERQEAVLEALRVLNEEVKTLEGNDFKAALARKKLNMILPGEIIYIITYDEEDYDE